MPTLAECQSRFDRSSSRPTFYAVVFCVEGDWQISTTFTRIGNARKLKTLLSEKWEAKIFMGGPGGIEVQ